MGLVRKLKASPALVVACIALLVSLTGTGVAAVEQLARNSVGTAQLKNNAVTTKKVKNNAITTTKVKNGSLLRADFKAGQIPAGAKGDKGDKGDTGNTGAPGAAGVIGNVISRFSEVPLADGANNSVQIACQGAEKLLGGGASLGVFADDLSLLSSRPSDAAGGFPVEGAPLTHWRAAARNAAGLTGATTLRVWVACGTA